MVKLPPTGVKINTNLVWTSPNTRGVEFNTWVFAVYTRRRGVQRVCRKLPIDIKHSKSLAEFSYLLHDEHRYI